MKRRVARNRYVTDLLKNLNKTSKYLREAYVFNEGEENGYGNPNMMQPQDRNYGGGYEGEYDDEYEDGYGDEGGYGNNGGYEEEGGYDDMPMQNRQSSSQQQGQEGDSAEEEAMHAQEIIKHEPIIAKIRDTAIDGLKKYSEDPTSTIYEFFKKVFLESDKVLTDTGENK